MSKKQKKNLYRIIVSAVLLAVMSFLPVEGWPRLLIFLIPYFLIGGDVLLSAGKNILRGQVFDEKFLMALATVGAFCTGEYPEAVFVMLFFQIGELFESIAVGKSRRSISQLMDIRPDYANVEKDGSLVQVDPDEVAVGTVIVIKPGEKVPLDGVVVDGSSALNTSALTGESMPRNVAPGSDVISGCVNMSGLLKVRTTKEFGQSTVSRILELVENSSASKSRSENFITSFARWYTPTVVICAVLLGLGVPLFAGNWKMWINRALVFLVISCPCALVISVPLSYFGGIGGASRKGILIKGSNYMDALSRCSVMVFDKTGTLTKGRFAVSRVCPSGCTEEELLTMAASAEQFSDHPIAKSLRQAAPSADKATDYTEIAGHGVSARVNGRLILAGNSKLMSENGIACLEAEGVGTAVHVAADGVYMGYVLIADELKPGVKEAISGLKERGVKKAVMLTGDAAAVGSAVAAEVGIDKVCAELLPEDKVTELEKLLGEKDRKTTLAYVGDGINDAPVLSRADVGIAMGGLGSDAAIEAADIVLMDDDPKKLPQALDICRKTRGIATQNIVFALAVKLIVLYLAATGHADMWAASFADVGVCVIAVLNAMRALK